MRVRPPSTAIRSLWWSRNRRSCSVAWTMKSERSRAASDASSPSRSLWLSMVVASVRCRVSLRVVFEVGTHPLAQEHRVMAFEDPLAGAMTESACRLVGLELVERRVVGQVEQDHVVEIPAVGDVEPADEADAELLLVVLHLPREDRSHEELEERVSAAADAEVGREHGHRCGPPRANGPGHAMTRRLLSHGPLVRWRSGQGKPASLAAIYAPASVSVVGVVRRGRCARILELSDRLRAARQRTTTAPTVRADEPEQEDDRLARHEQQSDHGEEQDRADDRRPVQHDAQWRQEDEEDQDRDLEAETPEPRPTLRLEVVALVLDGAGGRSRTSRWRRVCTRVERRLAGRVGGLVGHGAQRYGRPSDDGLASIKPVGRSRDAVLHAPADADEPAMLEHAPRPDARVGDGGEERAIRDLVDDESQAASGIAPTPELPTKPVADHPLLAIEPAEDHPDHGAIGDDDPSQARLVRTDRYPMGVECGSVLCGDHGHRVRDGVRLVFVQRGEIVVLDRADGDDRGAHALGRGSVARSSTTVTPGSAWRIAGAAITFHDREPPPRTIRSRAMTRESTQIGSSAGSPSASPPRISIPASAAVSSAGANDALPAPRRSRTARFTSSR